MYVVECKCIVKGFAHGEALISDTPINFLTMIDASNGEIKDLNHNRYGKTLKCKIFIFPYSVGSSVGSNRMDITTASGCAISNIPAVYLKFNKIPQAIRNSRALTVDGEKEQILIYPN